MLNRLMGMLYLLMNKETVTAAELSERFEVSVRTIYRDVETLSMAGIPIYTRKGKNGGISLTEQFVLDKMLVTKEEQQEILAALLSLEETGAQEEQETLRKLGDFFRISPNNWVSIDFSDWSGHRQELFGQIKQAILKNRLLEFDYYGQSTEMSRRVVEPVQLVFKDYTWYLRAYCRKRQAMRFFKIVRMKRVEVREESFLPDMARYGEAADAPRDVTGRNIQGSLRVITLKIAASEAYRIYDRFEEEELTRLDNGDYLVKMKCLLDDWVYGMILSYGPSAEVLSPEEVRLEVKRRLRLTNERYSS